MRKSLFFLALIVVVVVITMASGAAYFFLAYPRTGPLPELQVISSAGAVLSGAYFGDKMSPLSDTTNVCAIAARTERVRIGFNLLLLPLYDAVRLAEDLAAVWA